MSAMSPDDLTEPSDGEVHALAAAAQLVVETVRSLLSP
jgi:hypothetical protein